MNTVRFLLNEYGRSDDEMNLEVLGLVSLLDLVRSAGKIPTGTSPKYWLLCVSLLPDGEM